MYEEYVSVYQPVWYDNEYDMFLDNNPCDMMGIEELADNIISAGYPDEYEELFGSNYFIDLNEDTDPDMGLKIQARQS